MINLQNRRTIDLVSFLVRPGFHVCSAHPRKSRKDCRNPKISSLVVGPENWLVISVSAVTKGRGFVEERSEWKNETPWIVETRQLRGETLRKKKQRSVDGEREWIGASLLLPRDGDSDDVIIPNDAALCSRRAPSGGGGDAVGVGRPFRRS